MMIDLTTAMLVVSFVAAVLAAVAVMLVLSLSVLMFRELTSRKDDD